MRTIRVVGLTGGMASGKSLVAGILRSLGAVVVDADVIAREVVAPGSQALREIAAAFGDSVIQPDGTLDRRVLGERVFNDPGARARLNAITHPHIRRRMAEEVARARAARPDAMVFLDIPLLLDVTPPDAYDLDGVVVIAVDEATQEARLAARDGITIEAARRRLQAQRPLREKVALATWVIDNSGTPEATRRQAEDLWRGWRTSGPRDS